MLYKIHQLVRIHIFEQFKTANVNCRFYFGDYFVGFFRPKRFFKDALRIIKTTLRYIFLRHYHLVEFFDN